MSENNDKGAENQQLYCDVIGIDLGTSNSVIAVMKEGDRVEVLTSPEGSELTPSCVSYHRGQELVGQLAADKKFVDPKNTIYDAKRFIGMEFDARLKALAARYYPFQVVDGGGKKPLFSLTHDGQALFKRPQDISALVLKRLRETAERSLKYKATDVVQVRKAVITVPAYFSMAQKRATIEAATIAGFERVRLITEPAAAAYAYGFEKQRTDDDYRILVFDLGGGTFDVTVLDVHKGEFVQRAIDGDILLGGRDFDVLLREHCAAEIKRRWGYDYMEKSFRAQELLVKCEELKRKLSNSAEESIYVKLPEGIVELSVTRAAFEALCRPKLMEAVEIVRRLLADAQLAPAQIDEVLLVGGTSRIPLVRSLLISELGFRAEQLNGSENPDRVVAKGAAIFAAQLSTKAKDANGDDESENKFQISKIACSMKLTEAIPLSVGSKVMTNLFDPMIPRNSPIPFTSTRKCYTSINNQFGMGFFFYEGERRLAKENSFLGNLSFSGLPPGIAGSVCVELTMEIDQNGLLIARATHGGRTVEMNVEAYELRKSTDQSVSQALRDAELHTVGDRIAERRLVAHDELEWGIERSRYKCSKRTHDVCDEFDNWLRKHRRIATEEQFKAKLEELKCRLGPSYRYLGEASSLDSSSSSSD